MGASSAQHWGYWGAGSGVGGTEGFASRVGRAGSWYRHGGHFPKRGRSKLNHPIRGEVSPLQLAPSASGSTAIFQRSAVGFLHVQSVEVSPLQGLVFCKAVADCAVNVGLDVLEVATFD